MPSARCPAHAQTRYALSTREDEHVGVDATFGEVAKNEWRRALDEWVAFGSYYWDSFNDPAKSRVQIDDDTNPEKYAKLTDNAASTGRTAGPTR